MPWYVSSNGAGRFGAGLSTGVMMLATVLIKIAVPQALPAMFGYRTMLAAGIALLGVPALLLTVSAALPLVLAVCLARGAGLGIALVAATGMVAELAPEQRRAESLGLYGMAVSVPAVAGLPLGLWTVDRVGFGPVFVAGAAFALAAAVVLPGLPAVSGRGARDEPGGSVLGALGAGGIARPAVVLAATTLAAGVYVTFLPLAVSPGSRQVAAWALFGLSCATPLTRWAAGKFADRHGPGRLLLPAVLATVVGTAGLLALGDALAVITTMTVFGLGAGVAQNVTLALMLDRVPRAEFGRVSALWNLAYDAGLGVGAVGFGLVATPIGYRAGFALTAAVLFLALAPA